MIQEEDNHRLAPKTEDTKVLKKQLKELHKQREDIARREEQIKEQLQSTSAPQDKARILDNLRTLKKERKSIKQQKDQLRGHLNQQLQQAGSPT